MEGSRLAVVATKEDDGWESITMSLEDNDDDGIAVVVVVAAAALVVVVVVVVVHGTCGALEGKTRLKVVRGGDVPGGSKRDAKGLLMGVSVVVDLDLGLALALAFNVITLSSLSFDGSSFCVVGCGGVNRDVTGV